MDTKKLLKHVPWALLGILGAFCLAVVALRRGEHVSALWIVVASVSVYLVAYRYYSLYIAQKVMKLDPTRATPAVINNDGLNYPNNGGYAVFGKVTKGMDVVDAIVGVKSGNKGMHQNVPVEPITITSAKIAE